MLKDTAYYNRESKQYSSLRYPEETKNYVQFFFKRRLSILLEELGNIVKNKKELSLLEIGCADGVVTREIFRKYGDNFSSLVGIDIAKDMVDTAISKNTDTHTTFSLRDEYEIEKKFDVIVEVGVINYADFDSEVLFVKNTLESGGVYILSVAGNNSLNNFFKRGMGYKNFHSYNEYETKLRDHYIIDRILPVGVFLPLVWRMPFIAPIIQESLEIVFKFINKNLYHEKIYILRSK